MITLNISLIKPDMKYDLDAMAIWNRIYRVSNMRDMSIGELERRCGFPRSAIAIGRNRGTLPSLDRIYAISKELDVSTDYLLTGKTDDSRTLDYCRKSVPDFDAIVEKLMSEPLYRKLVSSLLELNKAQLLGVIGLVFEEKGLSPSKEKNGE